MALREKLHQSPEMQATSSGSSSSGTATTQGQGGPVESRVPGEVRPIVSLEKGDIEFWLQVATVVLLWMILQELKGGSA